MLLGVCVRVALSPHNQSIYAADYAPAGWHWLHSAKVYSHQHHFIYSPPVAAAFAPLSALPDSVGGILWRLLGAGLLLVVAAAWFRSRLASLGNAPAVATGPTAFLLFLPLAVGNINLGQMNVLILALTAASVLAVERRSWTLAASLLAVATFIKIYPLALGLLLVLLHPRQLSWRLLAALAGLFVVSLGLQHPDYVWKAYHQWFAALGGDDRLDVGLFAGWRDFGFLLRAVGVPLSDHAYRVMEVASGGALAIFLWLGQRGGRWKRETLLGSVFCLGCAWMMLFGPATEAATYVVLALPVCGLLASAVALPPSPGKLTWRILLVAVYILLFAADVANGWFRSLTHHLFMRALQPLAALVFTGGVVWRLRTLARAAPPDNSFRSPTEI